MNSPLPDNDAMHMPEVLLALKDLATRVVILERRIAASPATSWLPPSHFTQIQKDQISPPQSLLLTTDYQRQKWRGQRRGRKGRRGRKPETRET
jgi:hypothetical protein